MDLVPQRRAPGRFGSPRLQAYHETYSHRARELLDAHPGRDIFLCMPASSVERFPPRKINDRTFILFAQEDICLQGVLTRKQLPVDVMIVARHFHTYTLTWPPLGMPLRQRQIGNFCCLSTLDCFVGNYCNSQTFSDEPVYIEAGDPIARLSFDCCNPDPSATEEHRCAVAKRAVDEGPDVYKSLPPVEVFSLKLPRSAFRAPLEPMFDRFLMCPDMGPFIHEKEKKFNVKMQIGQLYEASVLSCSAILYCQERQALRLGKNTVVVSGVMVDTCEPYELESPVHGTPLALQCSMHTKRLERNVYVGKVVLTVVSDDPDNYQPHVLQPGDPVALVRSSLRRSCTDAILTRASSDESLRLLCCARDPERFLKASVPEAQQNYCFFDY